MTVIVGLERDGKIYMGADGMATWGNKTVIMTTPKIGKKGEFLLGGAGNLGSLQLLHYGFTMPPVMEKQEQIVYLINEFAPAFRKKLKECGFLEIDKSKETVSNSFLIGFRGMLFSVSGDLSMVQHADGYASVGSGSEFALGVLHAYRNDKKIKPEELIKKALEAAAHHNPYVQEPFEIISGAEVKEEK